MGEIADQIIEDSIDPSKKYYVVWAGVKPGIYDTWEECQKNVKSFPGAKYKSYTCNSEEAQEYFENGMEEIQTAPDIRSISVDASCLKNPGPVEYRGVYTVNGQVIFKQGPFPEGTNNIGEFLAIVHALAWLKKEGLNYPVYSDSQTALYWVETERVNTKLERTENNKYLFELIKRAQKWLRENTYENKVLKWQTHLWGEIKADYGKK